MLRMLAVGGRLRTGRVVPSRYTLHPLLASPWGADNTSKSQRPPTDEQALSTVIVCAEQGKARPMRLQAAHAHGMHHSARARTRYTQTDKGIKGACVSQVDLYFKGGEKYNGGV